MKDEKLVMNGLKMILKGLGEEERPWRASGVASGSPVADSQNTFKKAFSVFLLMIIIPGGVFLLNLYQQREKLLQQQTESAQRFTDSVLVGIRPSLVQGEMDEIQYQFQLYRQIHGVRSIQLIDQSGFIKRSVDSRDIGKRAEGMAIENALSGKRSFVSREDKSHNRKYMEMTVPLINEKQCYSCHGSKIKHLGVLRVILDAGKRTGS